MIVSILGINPPLVVPNRQGRVIPYAVVVPEEEGADSIRVNLLDKRENYPLDDRGKAKAIVKAINEAGFDIIPDSEVVFSSLTLEESTVLFSQKVNLKEKEPKNV